MPATRLSANISRIQELTAVGDDKNSRKIVIIGGGFGGLFTALDLNGAGEVTLINDEDHFLFRPMLYEYLSGEVEAWHIAPDCRELIEEQAKFIRGRVTSIDLASKTVKLAEREEPIPYNALVVSPGATTNYSGVEGAEAVRASVSNLE